MKTDTEIYIDVGPQKTGVTFRSHILYPAIAKQNNEVSYHNAYRMKDFVENVVYSDLRADKHIISFPLASGHIYFSDKDAVEERENATENISRWMPDANIVICRRDIDDLLESAWRQYIFSGGSRPYSTWINETSENVKYERYIQNLKELFDNVLVMDFELLQRSHQLFAERICRFIGVDIPRYHNRRLNPSLSVTQTEILRYLNKLWWTHERQGIPGFRLWRELLYMLTEKGKTDGGQQ